VNSTITAIATPHGVGSISIVRVSGERAYSIAKKMTRQESEIAPRYANLFNIYDDENRIIDKGIVIYFKAPHSFTGEDIVEFQTHGGVIISQLILKTILKYGGRVAEAGEFSKRAFLNGKIDLTEAEAISGIIEAKSEEATYQLSKQLNGELKIFVDEVRSSLVNILAYSEVTIDYAEEDLPEDITESIDDKLEKIAEELNRLLGSSRRRSRLFEGFKIAIVGRPNVGKSSLLNAILNYERAIVSDIEGTTRDRVEEYINIGTHLVKIVDTAGIRETDNMVEQIGIERSVSAIEEADIIIALFDGSEQLKEDDKKFIELIQRYIDQKEILTVMNKSDIGEVYERVEEFEPIRISSKQGNIQPLLDSLEEILTSINTSSDGGTVLSSVRQINEVENSIKAIQLSKESLADGELEIFSFHINEAIERISAISRPYHYDEMLDEMFGNFCLGK
jgi:tRNA modification GTPase